MEQAVLDSLIAGIFKFHDALVGYELYAYQKVFARRIMEAAITNTGDTITGLWSRQSGKTTAVAEVNVTLAILLPALAKAMPNIPELQQFATGVRIGIFAPVQQQASIAYGKMRTIIHSERAVEILEDPDIGVTIETSRGDTLELSNGSLVHAKTASPESKIEGQTYHIIIIDESQGIDRFKVEKEIEPMRASTNGVMVKIGTAWLSRGGFHSDIEYNIEYSRRGGPRNHFEFNYLMVIKERKEMYKRTGNPMHLSYEKYVKTQKQKQGEHSLAFRMNFLLKWQESNLDAISARALLDSQDKTREINKIYHWKEDEVVWPRVAGIDIAKSNDSTVVTILEVDITRPTFSDVNDRGETIVYYNSKVVGLLELQGAFEKTPNGPGQYNEILTFIRNWGVQKATVDATSMGDPVFERLTVLHPNIEWEPIRYTTSTKSDLFKHYLGEWESGRLKVASGGKSEESPEWERFYQQHKQLEKTMVGQYLSCHAPEPTSASAKVAPDDEYHDDYPNSGALAVWAGKNLGMGIIQVDTPRVVSSIGRQGRYARRH